MRLVAAALLLASGAALAAPASAQVPLPPLAAGEVSLQILGLGQVIAPADRAILRLQVATRGTDGVGAGRELQAKLDRIRTALRAAGVADTDAQIGAIAVSQDEAAAASSLRVTALLGAGRAPATMQAGGWPTTNATVPLVILVRDVARLPEIRGALEANQISVPQPEYFLAHDSAQRFRAREQALQRARADAETQAALLNMRIARIRRISERPGMDVFGLAANEVPTVLRQIARIWRGQAPEAETTVAVGVEFVLAPS